MKLKKNPYFPIWKDYTYVHNSNGTLTFRTTVSVLWLTIHSTILPLSVIVWVDFKGLEKRRGVAALQVGCRELQLPTSQWTKTVTGLPSVKKFRENTNTRTNKHWTTISNQSWWKSIIQKGKFVKSFNYFLDFFSNWGFSNSSKSLIFSHFLTFSRKTRKLAWNLTNLHLYQAFIL